MFLSLVFKYMSAKEGSMQSDSLGTSAEWSAELEVVGVLAVLTAHVSAHALLGTSVGHCVHVDLLEVLDGQALARGLVEALLGLGLAGLHILDELLVVLHGRWVVEIGQELVVSGVRFKLDWMLVVGEETVVSVSNVSKGAALKSSTSQRHCEMLLTIMKDCSIGAL